jgi:hypothetical protein
MLPHEIALPVPEPDLDAPLTRPAEGAVCNRCHTEVRWCNERALDGHTRCLVCWWLVNCPLHSVLQGLQDGPDLLCPTCVHEVSPRHLYRPPRVPLRVLPLLSWTLFAAAVVLGALWPIAVAILHHRG